MPASIRVAQRAQRVEPFYVMELAKAASRLAADAAPGTRPMIHLNIGEPDSPQSPTAHREAETAKAHRG